MQPDRALNYAAAARVRPSVSEVAGEMQKGDPLPRVTKSYAQCGEC